MEEARVDNGTVNRAKKPQKRARPHIDVGSYRARIVDDQRGAIIDIDTCSSQHSVDNRRAACVEVQVVARGKDAVHHKTAAIDVRRSRHVEIGVRDQCATAAQIEIAKRLNHPAVDCRGPGRYRPVAIDDKQVLNLKRRSIVEGYGPGSQGRDVLRLNRAAGNRRSARIGVQTRQRQRPIANLCQRAARKRPCSWPSGDLTIRDYSREKCAPLIAADREVL